MKKGVAGAVAAFLAAALLSGCGSEAAEPITVDETANETADEAEVLNEMDVDQYVTLGDYKNLGVTMEPITVDETEVEQWMLQLYHSAMTASDGITDRAVETGDPVDIDYQGIDDGVAFAGGTAQGALLTIGSHRFIDGFEDGLIGVMPGETVELNLAFPENYGNAELAGHEVVFVVTVNYIVPQVKDMEDSVVAALGDDSIASVADLRQYVYDYLYDSMESEYYSEMESQILYALVAKCTYEELPEGLVEEYRGVFTGNLENQAAAWGMTAESLANVYGMTAEEFVDFYASESARQSLALQAIANRENLKVSDEELKELLEMYAANAGYSTVEEYLGETPKEQYRNYFMTQKVVEFLMDQHQTQ